MRSSPVPDRSRTRGQRTATGPTPVTISRSGRWPWRTSLWRPSSVSLSAWQLSRAATSASTACASSARAPLRKTSVSGSAKVPGWESWKTLVSVTAYHSFGGEVEASNTPTIRRLTPSCRHQLLRIALCLVCQGTCRQAQRIACRGWLNDVHHMPVAPFDPECEANDDTLHGRGRGQCTCRRSGRLRMRYRSHVHSSAPSWDNQGLCRRNGRAQSGFAERSYVQ